MDQDSSSVTSRDSMIYDWFKHLTSLSLLALGGALSLSQLPDVEVKKGSLTMVVLLLAAAGIAAFGGADQLVRATADGKPIPRQVHWMRTIATLLLGFGLGAFLSVFMESLA